MGLKKIGNKFKIGKNILIEEGPINLAIRSLKYIQKDTSPRGPSVKKEIFTKASTADIIAADFHNHPKSWTDQSFTGPCSFLWIMPPPGKGSGGHLNIFRFIKCLEEAGHSCQIYLDLGEASGSTEHVKAVMDDYPVVKATKTMKWLSDRKENVSEFHGIFATSCKTAYSSYNLETEAKRFYFVQDFEPYFYPVGSLFYLAENTYKFNFYGVTAGGWLAKKLRTEYGMQTDHYNFGAENSLYSLKNKERDSIFFYARPYTERRGFEVGILTLNLFNKLHPQYKIIFAGWDVSDYNIPFPYENLKTLELSELNDVYNRCVAALILSYTNMSLLPLEVMAAGAIPIVNDAPNNQLVSDNKYIKYTHNDPVSLAKALSDVVSMKNFDNYSKAASKSAQGESWSKSEEKFLKIIEKRMQTNE